MKKKSSQPRKQRKTLFNLALHKKRKEVSAHLSPELRKKHGKRNFPLKKGDKVKILKGKYSKKEGKIIVVNLKRMKVGVEGITKKKPNGVEKPILLEPSNLMIIELDLKDKRREEAIKKGKNQIKESNK